MKKLILIILISLPLYSFAQNQTQLILEEEIDRTHKKNVRIHEGFVYEYMPIDFSGFNGILADYNISLLNRINQIYAFHVGLTTNRVIWDLGFGWAGSKQQFKDSLRLSADGESYSFNLGYELIKAKWLTISPIIGLKIHRYELYNAAEEDEISLTDYLQNPDVNLVFNQMFASFGLDMSFALSNDLNDSYFSLGLQGAYLQKLNENPWIYAGENKINSAGKIDSENFNLKASLILHMK